MTKAGGQTAPDKHAGRGIRATIAEKILMAVAETGGVVSCKPGSLIGAVRKLTGFKADAVRRNLPQLLDEGKLVYDQATRELRLGIDEDEIGPDSPESAHTVELTPARVQIINLLNDYGGAVMDWQSGRVISMMLDGLEMSRQKLRKELDALAAGGVLLVTGNTRRTHAVELMDPYRMHVPAFLVKHARPPEEETIQERPAKQRPAEILTSEGAIARAGEMVRRQSADFEERVQKYQERLGNANAYGRKLQIQKLALEKRLSKLVDESKRLKLQLAKAQAQVAVLSAEREQKVRRITDTDRELRKAPHTSAEGARNARS